MNYPPDFFSGFGGSGDDTTNRPSPRKELQGPRPPSLKVNKDSHKITKKPPLAPSHHPPRAAVDHRQNQNNNPVIIYDVSPKVIHTTANDFMSLVQRLTGHSDPPIGDDIVSPAARLASIERAASPRGELQPPAATTSSNFGNFGSTSSTTMDDLLQEMENQEIGGGARFSAGILSPAPNSLPPISPGFFSPASSDPWFGNMLVPSPSWSNLATAAAAPVPSPSTLFSPSIISPSSTDYLFNTFFDY